MSALRNGSRRADRALVAVDGNHLVEQATGLCEEGHFAEAGDLLRPFAERDPSGLAIWGLLARAELAAGHCESALQAAEHVQALAPGEAVPHLIASVALVQLDRSQDAIAQVRAAVRLDPEDWWACGWLARILVAASSFEEARDVAARAVELAPEQPAVHLTAGVVAAAVGERETARAAFREVLALDPASSAAQHELARLQLRRKANDPAVLAEAAAGFARAAGADPGARRSQLSLERVLRVFLSKTSYLLLLDAYLAWRVAATSSTATARLIPITLLAIPAYYATRFLRHLTPVPGQRGEPHDDGNTGTERGGDGCRGEDSQDGDALKHRGAQKRALAD